MERKVAQLNHEGFYLGEAMAYSRGLPGNAREEFPPEGALPEHHRWRWNGSEYELTPDYRGQEAYRPDGVCFRPDAWGPLPAGCTLTPPPPSPAEALAEAIADKKAAVLNGYEAAFAPVCAAYPATEREGWTIQLEEARAVLADPSAAAPTLALMVAERAMGESVDEFAGLVIANNTYYRQVYAALTGQQQRMYRDVESMAVSAGLGAAEVEAYPVEYRLPEGL